MNAQHDSDEDGIEYAYVDNFIDGQEFVNAFIGTYLITLGDYHTSGYSFGPNVWAVWIVFFLASAFLTIIMLNFIITIMSEPFERVQEKKEIYRKRQ